MSSVISAYKKIRFQTNCKRKHKLYTSLWKLNNTLENHQVHKKYKGRFKKSQAKQKIKAQHIKTYGIKSVKIVLWGIYRPKLPHQKVRESSNK